MVVVYRVPAVIPEHVRAAFEERGVRLRLGDRVVVEDGEPPSVLRELDYAITPYLSSLPVVHVEASSSQPSAGQGRDDRQPWPCLVRDAPEGQTA